MIDFSRQELQDDIFRMYGACIVSENGKSKNAPIDIDRLRKLLTGGESSYRQIDFETELNYLIESKYFKLYATHFIIPTAHGMNKIWGKTTNIPLDSKNETSKWWEKTWIQVIFLVGAILTVVSFIWLFFKFFMTSPLPSYLSL